MFKQNTTIFFISVFLDGLINRRWRWRCDFFCLFWIWCYCSSRWIFEFLWRIGCWIL